VQQEKDGILIEMPNEILNEMHADNDWLVEMPRSESRTMWLRGGGAEPAINMQSPSPTEKKPTTLTITHEVIQQGASLAPEIGRTVVLARGTVE
jgi:hypothetical protein